MTLLDYIIHWGLVELDLPPRAPVFPAPTDTATPTPDLLMPLYPWPWPCSAYNKN